MKHRVLLRRALPLAVLAAVLYSAGWPASAFFFQKDEAVPTVAAMTKNGPAAEPISFSEEDFVVEGSGKLDSIVIATLPDAAVGCLTLGAQGIQVGDVIAMEAVDGLRFTPLAAPAGLEAQFQFTPVFSDGRSGDAVTVELYLLAEANGAPVAENLEFTTYKNVAVDAVGNSSDPATVKIKIEKPNTKVTYADMDGDPAHKAAIRLAEEGIFVGECMGGAYFFQPDAAVTRGEFVAMAMNAAGMEALEDVERTGFADDVSIPTWAKPYVSSALKAGLVQGSRSSDGQVVFQAEEPITAAEAAVLLDRALQVTDVSADTLAEEGIPTWAAQSAANLATCGVLSLDGGLSAPLTRGEAAELLCGALELQDSRDGGWF